MADSQLGTCTTRHRDVVYTHTHEHPSAVRLAHIASRLVDATKHGFRLKMDKWEAVCNELRVPEPDYVKGVGERKTSNPKHILDRLVLKVIPNFRESMLSTFHKEVGTEGPMYIDRDIKAFYDRIAQRRDIGQAMDLLRDDLRNLREEWSKFYVRKRNDQEKMGEEIRLSPRGKFKRTYSDMDRNQIVYSP